jgi:hypothetical protein
MHAPIPTESASPGKVILPKVHSAEGKGRFKEHVLIVEDGGTVGWDRTSDLRIHNPAL